MKIEIQNKTSNWIRIAMLCVLVAILVSSCTTHNPELIAKMHVDVSEGVMECFCPEGKKVTEVPVETSRKGIGHKKHSKKTPTGEYTLTKDDDHRFGPVCRLSGYQGWQRGILLHRDFVPGNGTNGCICPTEEDWLFLYPMIVDEAEIKVVP